MSAPDRIDHATAAVVAGALFVVYALGASPSIYVGDSGELVAAAATLGIPHPSGYPLYVLLGKLWTLAVPVGEIAYRMSLFSAACGSLAAAVLYLTLRTAGLSRPASAGAALAAGLAPSFWSQANVQRVYTLNALCLVGSLWPAVAWFRHRSRTALTAAFFIAGVGACNHLFMVLFGASLALFVVLAEPRLVVRPIELARLGLRCGAAFAAGLLPYLYLPIRSAMNPRLDWGDPETFENFIAVVGRHDFWERAYLEGWGDLAATAADYATSFPVELTWAGVALAAVGAAALGRSGYPVALSLLVMLVNYLALSMHGSRSDIFIWHRYYIPSYLAAAALMAVGWDRVASRLPALARWSVLAVPALLLATGWRAHDRSEFYIAEDFANAVLESVPPGAHLSATDDNVLFVLIYLHLVEGARPDVNLILQGVGKADLPPLRFDPASDPLYFTHHPNWDLPELEIVPMGVVYRAHRRRDPWPEPVLPRSELAGEHDPNVPKDYLTQNLLGHFHYTLGFTFERRDWPRARREFDASAAAAPANDVLFYNLGLVYARNGLYDDAVAAFARSHEINPRHIASLSKPRASQRLELTRAEQARVAAVEDAIAAAHELPPAATTAYHEHMAALLDGRGEQLAAHGHRLRALELAAGE